MSAGRKERAGERHVNDMRSVYPVKRGVISASSPGPGLIFLLMEGLKRPGRLIIAAAKIGKGRIGELFTVIAPKQHIIYILGGKLTVRNKSPFLII
jgi:hypothetical protein